MLNYREELVKPLLIHIIITIVPITFFSWLSLTLFGVQDVLTIVLLTVILTIITLSISALFGMRLVLSLFNIRWINRESDFVLWNLVNSESERLKISFDSIGIIDLDVPNAFVASGIQDKTILLYTRGLLFNLSYNELQAITTYLLGCYNSGLLSYATILSGLQTIGTRLARGYVEDRVKKKSTNISHNILGGWGYLCFSAFNHQTSIIGRDMVNFSDSFSLDNVSNIVNLFTALIKVSYLQGLEEDSYMRTCAIGLKALMFQDPSLSVLDHTNLRKFVASHNIPLERLVGDISLEKKGPSNDRLHMFEKYWLHKNFEYRIGKIVEVNKDSMITQY